MNETLVFIFQLIVLIFSVMVHEVTHGAVAYRLGDDTAKNLGRLTLNPMKHIDPVGSVLLPLFLYIASRGNFIFGWAKPVPFNPFKLKNPTLGAAIIGAAGPLSNFSLAIIFGLLIRLIGPLASLGVSFVVPMIFLFNIIVYLNIMLGVFNLVPIAPLDGSRILYAIIPNRYARFKMFLEQYGSFILIFFLFFGFQWIVPFINAIYLWVVGQWGIL